MKRVILLLTLLMPIAAFADEYDTIIERLDRIISEAQAAKAEVNALRPVDPDPTPGVVDFPVIAVRMARADDVRPHWPIADKPAKYDTPADLVKIAPDGTETVLVATVEGQAAVDPMVSFDGKKIVYALISGIDHSRNTQGILNSDIYIYDTVTGVSTQVTHQPADKPVLNLGACWLSDDQLMFVSDRDTPRLDFFGLHRSLQLHVIDTDGSNVEKVGHLNLHGALHPSLKPDGRAMWSSGEGMAYRGDEQWGLWHSNPDGTDWGPLWSAFTSHSGLPFPVHFQTALPSGEIVVAQYYKQKNYGTGILHKFDPSKGFSSPADLFEPIGAVNLTPLSPLKDWQAPKGGDEWNNDFVGKWSHPAAAPKGMLATWTGHSPTNEQVNSPNGYLPNPRGSLCYISPVKEITGLEDFKVVKQSSNFSYIQPVALVPYMEIHGVGVPPIKPWLPQGQHEMLPVGTPYGIIGTDTVYVRESKTEGTNKPWRAQGSDIATGYENSDIEYVRILLTELSSSERTRTTSFGNVSPERLKILADVPIHKPDGSFQVKLPADNAFAFQLLNEKHEVLTMAQTWRMVRSGEVHRNCRGCHAHWHPSMGLTEAEWNALPDPVDLTDAVPVGYDFETHVAPILEAHCNACHESEETAPDLAKILSRPYGGAFDTAISTPFRALDSTLYQRITSDDPAQRMPLNHPPLSAEEIDTIKKWLDTGCQDKNSNIDDQKPTLHIESPRRRTEPITEIVFGAADFYGINDTLTVVEASWIEGNLFGSHTEADGVFTVPLPGAVAEGSVTISVTDSNGNTQTQTRIFRK